MSQLFVVLINCNEGRFKALAIPEFACGIIVLGGGGVSGFVSDYFACYFLHYCGCIVNMALSLGSLPKFVLVLGPGIL
jgi:hypothetical protein